MKKKIVILSLTMGYGGIEKYISSLCKMFNGKYDVTILCNYKELEKPAFNLYGANVEYLIDNSFRKESIKKMLVKAKFIGIVKELLGRAKTKYLEKYLMKKKIKSLDCDIVITTRISHNKLVNKYLGESDIVKIATEHNSYDITPTYDKKLCKSISKYNYLILVSKTQKEHYEKMYDRCIYIPNVIDEIPNKQSKLDKLNIISVGRFSPEKGFLDLVRVMSKIVDKNNKLKLYLVGDGYQKEEITNLVNKLSLQNNIVLTGYKNQKELEKYYLNSSLYVMTSYSEAFGIVLLEAMSYGVPCIAFDSAEGAKEIINESKGVIIEDRNLDKMADTIINLITDKKKLLDMQKNDTKVINKYHVDEVSKKWINLLEKK